jgi:hypothetical protein
MNGAARSSGGAEAVAGLWALVSITVELSACGPPPRPDGYYAPCATDGDCVEPWECREDASGEDVCTLPCDTDSDCEGVEWCGYVPTCLEGSCANIACIR